jgi:hypothetical protein
MGIPLLTPASALNGTMTRTSFKTAITVRIPRLDGPGASRTT